MKGLIDGLAEFDHSVFGVFTKVASLREEKTSDTLDLVGTCALPTTNDLRVHLNVKVFRPSRFAARLVQPTFPFRLSRALRGQEIDLIHTHYPNRIDLQARAILDYLKVPMLWTVHSLPEENAHTVSQLKRFNKIGRSHRGKVKIVTVTRLIKEFVGRFCPDVDIDVIYNGSQIERSNDLTRVGLLKRLDVVIGDPTVVCSVARLNPEKGVEFLVRAARIVAETADNVIFIHLGEGYLGSHLRNLVKELGLEKRFFFLGHQQNVSSYLSASDLFVLPSLGEACSLALLEALFIGLPSVVTDVGGNPEVSDRRCSIFVPPANDRSLAEAILELNANAPRSRLMGSAALERSKKFSMTSTISNYRSAYGRLLETSKVSATGEHPGEFSDVKDLLKSKTAREEKVFGAEL